MPALIAVADASTGAVHDRIEEDLRSRLDALVAEAAPPAWPSFHLSRARARRLLVERYRAP